MELTIIDLEREFIIEDGNTHITIADPDPGQEVEEIMALLSDTYPMLTTATYRGPEVINDKRRYTFQSAIGTKG